MKISSVPALVVLVATIGVAARLAPASTHAQTSPADEQDVREAEARRFRALATGDLVTLESLLADDLTYTHSTGVVDDRAAYLAPLRDGRTRYREADGSELRVRIYGEAAIVNGRARLVAIVGGEVRPNDLRYTNVWVRRDGRWRLAAWHASPVQ